MATAPSPAPGPGPGRESGTETVKRPSAEQDVNFAAKRDAQGCEPDRFGEAGARQSECDVRVDQNECRRVACY